MPPSLHTAKYVYIRINTVKTSLQRPYSGPYSVLAPGEKTVLVDMGGRAERISIDRYKPAQVDPTKPVQLQQPARRGRPPALLGPPSATETDDTRGQPTAQTHFTHGATSATVCELPVTQRDVCAAGRCVTDSQTKLLRSVIAFVYYDTRGLPVYLLSCLVEIKPVCNLLEL